MTGEEARQAAGADLDPVLVECCAQLAQEDLWAGPVDLQDEIGMSLEATRALIASQGLGCDVPLALLLSRCCCCDQRLTLARLTPKRSAT